MDLEGRADEICVSFLRCRRDSDGVAPGPRPYGAQCVMGRDGLSKASRRACCSPAEVDGQAYDVPEACCLGPYTCESLCESGVGNVSAPASGEECYEGGHCPSDIC